MSMAALKIFSLGVVSLLLASVAAVDVPPTFGYKGSIGPSHWASLSSNWTTCGTGRKQSPINIVENEVVLNPSLHDLKTDYSDAYATLFNNVFNIELRYEEAVGNVLIEGKNYSLQRLHWHSPSEHTINGQRFAFEQHLVHKSQDGNIAVIAILYKFGRADPLLNQLMGGLQELAKEVSTETEPAQFPVRVVENESLKDDALRYYRYIGSLSVPPCTENVSWTVLAKVREMAREQAHALKAPLTSDYRLALTS